MRTSSPQRSLPTAKAEKLSLQNRRSKAFTSLQISRGFTSAQIRARCTSPSPPELRSSASSAQPNGGEMAAQTRTTSASSAMRSAAALIATAAHVRIGSAWTYPPKQFLKRSTGGLQLDERKTKTSSSAHSRAARVLAGDRVDRACAADPDDSHCGGSDRFSRTSDPRLGGRPHT